MKFHPSLFLSLCLLLALPASSQLLEGKWVVTKGNTEIGLEIKGGAGTIVSLSSTKEFTDKILGGIMYENIRSTGPAKWSATRNTWKYWGISRVDQEKGRWEKAGNCQFSLGEDGNTLSVAGHWTWKRKDPIGGKAIDAEPTLSGDTGPLLASLDANYDGVQIRYSAYVRQKDTIVLIRMQNRLEGLDARVSLANSRGLNDVVVLAPGNTVTKTVRSFPFGISIEFSKNLESPQPMEKWMMELIRKKVKENINIQSKTIQRIPASWGVRG